MESGERTRREISNVKRKCRLLKEHRIETSQSPHAAVFRPSSQVLHANPWWAQGLVVLARRSSAGRKVWRGWHQGQPALLRRHCPAQRQVQRPRQQVSGAAGVAAGDCGSQFRPSLRSWFSFCASCSGAALPRMRLVFPIETITAVAGPESQPAPQ